MNQSNIGLREASHNLLRIVLLGAALAFGAAPSEASATTHHTEPQIEKIQVGLAGHYKVGCWTAVRVEMDSVASSGRLIEVTVPDSDGVDTTVASELSDMPSEFRSTAVLYSKFGRMGSPLRVSIVDDGRRIDEVLLEPGRKSDRGELLPGVPPTGELLVALGSVSIGLAHALSDRDAENNKPARRVVQLEHVSDLPSEWFGYEAVDLLIIVAGDGALMHELAADEARHAALVRWVELGGRLVILCGGDAAPELLSAGGPLAALAPGKLAEVVRLPETAPLEHFAKSDAPIAGAGTRSTIIVPRLVDVEGSIEVYAGRRPTDLPLIVRTARGLGEVAFAGVDPAKPPLADWAGRSAFLQALVQPYLANTETGDASQTLVTRGYDDLSGALRQGMGRSFVGMTPIAFPVVTVLAFAYLLVLGPVDYVIVHRWLRRPLAAWITFPLIVLAFGAAALALDYWRTASGGPRVNRLELVDFDMVAGQARGTFWATLYSPRADQFDLALNVESPWGENNTDAEVLLSWWGLPGVGIGGMQAEGADLGIIRGGYEFAPELNALMHVPVLTGSTKSLLARWTAPVGPVIKAQLVDRDGLVEGSIENHTGRSLRNVRLFYNRWAYRLRDLKSEGRIEVREEISPRLVKTIVTQDALGFVAPGQAEGTMFMAERASAEQILNLMMFFEAAGGLGFAQLPSHYQAYCDLSRLLDLGRAILVADAATPGSRLVDADSREPLGEEQDSATVVYRFVLAVDRE